jgi:hypothetical protein
LSRSRRGLSTSVIPKYAFQPSRVSPGSATTTAKVVPPVRRFPHAVLELVEGLVGHLEPGTVATDREAQELAVHGPIERAFAAAGVRLTHSAEMTCAMACCMKRSNTVGMPSGRFFPSALSISTRLTGCGR